MENMIATLESICGIRPEITIRGEKAFTFSFDSVEREAAEKLARFFAGHQASIDHDDECGTCVYVDFS